MKIDKMPQRRLLITIHFQFAKEQELKETFQESTVEFLLHQLAQDITEIT